METIPAHTTIASIDLDEDRAAYIEELRLLDADAPAIVQATNDTPVIVLDYPVDQGGEQITAGQALARLVSADKQRFTITHDRISPTADVLTYAELHDYLTGMNQSNRWGLDLDTLRLRDADTPVITIDLDGEQTVIARATPGA